MITEIWKYIPGYEPYYKVSNLGNVVSFFNYKYGLRIVPKPMKTQINRGGYLCCTIRRKNEKSKAIKVHQLVAMAFLNHIPSGNKLVVDHIDNNKLNNKLENLQIITNRENICKDLKNKESKFIGVKRAKNKWNSSIRIGNKKYHIGNFEIEEEAEKAYNEVLQSIENNTFDIDIFKKYRKVPKSGFKGVYPGKSNRWYSQIRTKDGVISLGSFNSKEEASKKYLEELIKIKIKV